MPTCATTRRPSGRNTSTHSSATSTGCGSSGACARRHRSGRPPRPEAYTRSRMNPRALALAAVLALATPASAGDLPPDAVRPRVEYHLRAANELADHFDAVVRNGCPRFTTTSQWDAYVNDE